jgi:hypothetical protein
VDERDCDDEKKCLSISSESGKWSVENYMLGDGNLVGKSVSQYVTDNAPFLHMQVKGREPGHRHMVFPTHYCSCQSFFYDVVSQSSALNVGALDALIYLIISHGFPHTL